MSEINSLLSVAKKVNNMAIAGLQGGSLIEFTRTTRVEPVVLLEQNLSTQPYMTDVLQSINTIFAAYYLQAVNQLSTVGGTSIIKILDPLNPNRDVLRNAVGFVGATLESLDNFKYQLPVPNKAFGLEHYIEPKVSLEDDKKSLKDKIAGHYGIGDDKKDGKEPASESKLSSKGIQEAVNLSVGKLIDVTLKAGNQEVTIPVAIRLIVSLIDSNTLVHTLSLSSKDLSVAGRYSAWKHGALSFMRDLILSQDLIDEHRRNLMKDKTGFYATNAKRNNRNIMSSIISGTPSLSSASNIMVMSKNSADKLEMEMGGRLKDFKFREKLFSETYVMLLVVVDTQWEMVKVYHRSIENPTELSVRDMKGASKDTSTDIVKLLQAYHAGSAPTL